jgi:hypothetical protein
MKAVKRDKLLPLTSAAGKALVRAAKAARRTARMYRTPVYIEENGKIVAVRP